MIEIVFTIDYEIYGNGDGSLKELVYEPASKLKDLFERWKSKFVVFVEAAELEVIESNNADDAISLVKEQVVDFFNHGFELGLHLHPQWYNAKYQNGRWLPDYREYNLCKLPEERIAHLLDRSITYLGRILKIDNFCPLSFRAGNWLLQPTRPIARLLFDRGIRIDSSVFKGGYQHKYQLDYRPALKNGYYWPFTDDVNVASPKGKLIEIPTYVAMKPIWKLFSTKRMGLQQKSSAGTRSNRDTIFRLFDFFRFQYPLKLDFCRMRTNELIHMLDEEMQKDQKDPSVYRPIVAIGHTKDLKDLRAVDALLSYIKKSGLAISGFSDVHSKVRMLVKDFNG